MISAWLGLVISLAAVAFGVVQLRRGDERNGKLAIALGVVGIVFNGYALLRGL